MTERTEFQHEYRIDVLTMARFDHYAALLAEWQIAMNLVAPSTLGNIWHRHFADSAQLAYLVRDVATPSSCWLDIGSGAGFPALVIALLRPGRFHLVEATAKKCRFLSHVVEVLGLAQRVEVHCARIEDLKPLAADFITARACTSLVKLFAYGEQHGGKARWLLLKGRTVEQEVAMARANFDFNDVLIPSRTDSDARIVDATEVRRRRR